MDRHDLYPVLNTLRASKLKMILVRLFGKKLKVKDSVGFITTTAVYEGREYFLDYKEDIAL